MRRCLPPLKARRPRTPVPKTEACRRRLSGGSIFGECGAPSTLEEGGELAATAAAGFELSFGSVEGASWERRRSEAAGGEGTAAVPGSEGDGEGPSLVASAASQGGIADADAAKPEQEEEIDEWVVVDSKRRRGPKAAKAVDAEAQVAAAGRVPPTRAPVAYASGAAMSSAATPRSTAVVEEAKLVRHQLKVGIEDHAGFRVAKRLIGAGGENMKNITSECPRTWVELRGAGTNPSKGEDGPLVLHIRGYDAQLCARAVELAELLIADTVKEYNEFLAGGSSGDAPQRQTASRRPAKQAESACRSDEERRSQEESTSANGSAPGTECDAADSEDDGGGGESLHTQATQRIVSQLSVEAQQGSAGAVGAGERRGARGLATSSRREPREGGRPGGSSAASTGTPGGTGGAAAAAGRSGRWPEHREVPVGLDDTQDFRVVRKLIGPGGENMRYIAAECPGTRVELRGAGTNPWANEETGPLVLHIQGHDAEQCDIAVQLAKELLEHVHEEHRQRMARKERWAKEGAGASAGATSQLRSAK